MAGFGIELTPAEHQPDIASANLNGTDVTFAVVGPTLLVRADLPTEIPTKNADPWPFLAANQINTVTHAAKACVLDRLDHLVLRAEKDTDATTGISDAQLSVVLKRSVDSVLKVAEGTSQFLAEMISSVAPDKSES